MIVCPLFYFDFSRRFRSIRMQWHKRKIPSCDKSAKRYYNYIIFYFCVFRPIATGIPI
jgi:hypothetical protein